MLCGVVAGDVQSVTGRNLHLLRQETGANVLNISQMMVKEALGQKKAIVPSEEAWRVGYLGKLLHARGEALYKGEDTSQVTSLIGSLCLN